MRENSTTASPKVVAKMLEKRRKARHQRRPNRDRPARARTRSPRILVYSLMTNREYSLSNAFIRASGQELARYEQGMAVLDTVITAAPLLGLLGTVTGMMRTFGALNTSGGGGIADSAGAITGGVAEALMSPPAAVSSSRSSACFPIIISMPGPRRRSRRFPTHPTPSRSLIAKSETEAAR